MVKWISRRSSEPLLGVRIPPGAQKAMSQNYKEKFNSFIPAEVSHVTETLEKAGFEAYLVGGCVRDLFLVKQPKDWDITTNAKPEQIIGLFEKTVYENNFGTVAVCIPKVSRETLSDETLEKYEIIEVTPYRIEGKYNDSRHPESVIFSETIEEDLKRRDFTVNAVAYNISQGHIIDLFEGQADIKDKTIRTVGDAKERFGEDALRMLRAIRFSTQLGFSISHETIEGIFHSHELLQNISRERIRDEFSKIIMSPEPMLGIGLLNKLSLLKYIVVELEEGINCEQKGEHVYDVFEHMLHALRYASEKQWPLEIRLAALFHDIGKPRTRRWDGTKAGGKGKYTFYGHEVVGARMTEKIMGRLRYPKEVSEKVVKLVRYHMFFSDTEQITLSAVRRLIRNIGPDMIWDLMNLRDCDRAGMNKKEGPYRLRKFHAMIEEAMRAPTSVSMLKIDGARLIEMGETPGPKFGFALHALLEEVLDNPELNTAEYLEFRVRELLKLPLEELKTLGEAGKEKKEEVEVGEIKKIYRKHKV